MSGKDEEIEMLVKIYVIALLVVDLPSKQTLLSNR